MNRYHRFVEAIESGAIEVRYGYEAFVKQGYEKSMMARAAKSPICFDGGEISNMDGMRSVLGLQYRLPYQCCWIEFQTQLGVAAYLCEIHENKMVGDYLFRYSNDKTWCHGFNFVIDEESYDFGGISEDEGLDEDALFQFMAPLLVFLSAINCVNVKLVEHHPPEKLQKARAKRGKCPLFSHWTLAIDVPRTARDRVDHGGTHQSPRVHLRRGHAREYSPGKWTWVQPCVVGNKAAGMVHKDYSARYVDQHQ